MALSKGAGQLNFPACLNFYQVHLTWCQDRDDSEKTLQVCEKILLVKELL